MLIDDAYHFLLFVALTQPFWLALGGAPWRAMFGGGALWNFVGLALLLAQEFWGLPCMITALTVGMGIRARPFWNLDFYTLSAEV
jgi:hypothetical protein